MNWFTSFFRAFKSIFRKKKIVFTSRAGALFHENGKTYFIDTELLAGPDSEIAVYENEVALVNGNSRTALNPKEAEIILVKFYQELDKIGLRVAPNFSNKVQKKNAEL